MKNKIKEAVEFMHTDEWGGYPFDKFIKERKLSDEEFIKALEIYSGDSPLKLITMPDGKTGVCNG